VVSACGPINPARAPNGVQGLGYAPLSTDDDLPVAQLSCRLRPVARPSWPELARRPALSEVRVGFQFPALLPVHDEGPRVSPLGGFHDALQSTVLALQGLDYPADLEIVVDDVVQCPDLATQRHQGKDSFRVLTQGGDGAFERL